MLNSRLTLGASSVVASLALITGCGDVTKTADAGSADRTSPGCAVEVAPIVESKAYTSWDARMTHPAIAPPRYDAASAFKAVDAGMPPTVNGLEPQASYVDENFIGVIYGDEKADLAGESYRALDLGGVLVTRSETESEDDIAESMQEMIGDRAVPVEVGDTIGVLTWSDPNEAGIRPHVVTWVFRGVHNTVSAVAPAEEAVRLAREIACRRA